MVGRDHQAVGNAERSGCMVTVLLRATRRFGIVAVEWLLLCGALAVMVANRVFEPVPVWVVIPTTFRFYWFVPVFPVTVYALVRRRKLRHLPALIAVVLFLWLYGWQMIPKPGGSAGNEFTVMTFNVQWGRHGADSISRVINAVHPDVIALQEVTIPNAGSGDVISRIEDRLGYQCAYRPYYTEEQSSGMAVCVQPPIAILNVQRRTYHSRGRWSYLFAEMAIDGRTVNMVVPHLVAFRISGADPVRDHRQIWRRLTWASRWHHRETSELLRLVAGFKDPTIMAGDFNSTPGQAIHSRIRRSLTDAFRARGFGIGATYRFGLPIRIDYVYLSRGLKALSAEVGPVGFSDHRPVIVRVGLRG